MEVVFILVLQPSLFLGKRQGFTKNDNEESMTKFVIGSDFNFMLCQISFLYVLGLYINVIKGNRERESLIRFCFWLQAVTAFAFRKV